MTTRHRSRFCLLHRLSNESLAALASPWYPAGSLLKIDVDPKELDPELQGVLRGEHVEGWQEGLGIPAETGFEFAWSMSQDATHHNPNVQHCVKYIFGDGMIPSKCG